MKILFLFALTILITNQSLGDHLSGRNSGVSKEQAKTIMEGKLGTYVNLNAPTFHTGELSAPHNTCLMRLTNMMKDSRPIREQLRQLDVQSLNITVLNQSQYLDDGSYELTPVETNLLDVSILERKDNKTNKWSLDSINSTQESYKSNSDWEQAESTKILLRRVKAFLSNYPLEVHDDLKKEIVEKRPIPSDKESAKRIVIEQINRERAKYPPEYNTSIQVSYDGLEARLYNQLERRQRVRRQLEIDVNYQTDDSGNVHCYPNLDRLNSDLGIYLRQDRSLSDVHFAPASN